MHSYTYEYGSVTDGWENTSDIWTWGRDFLEVPPGAAGRGLLLRRHGLNVPAVGRSGDPARPADLPRTR